MADSLWPELLEDVLDHTVEPVAPSGRPLGTPRPQRANAGVTDAHRQRQEASEAGGEYMIANRGHTRLHTHWRCPSVFPLDMFRGASRGENTYKRWTKPGQLRKCWPNLFIFLHDVQHVIWSHMHSYTVLPYHCGTNTLTTVIPGSGYTSRSAREHERVTTFWGVLFWKENDVKKKKKMSLWWFFLNRTSCWRPHIKHSNSSRPPLDINCTVRN